MRLHMFLSNIFGKIVAYLYFVSKLEKKHKFLNKSFGLAFLKAVLSLDRIFFNLICIATAHHNFQLHLMLSLNSNLVLKHRQQKWLFNGQSKKSIVSVLEVASQNILKEKRNVFVV